MKDIYICNSSRIKELEEFGDSLCLKRISDFYSNNEFQKNCCNEICKRESKEKPLIFFYSSKQHLKDIENYLIFRHDLTNFDNLLEVLCGFE